MVCNLGDSASLKKFIFKLLVVLLEYGNRGRKSFSLRIIFPPWSSNFLHRCWVDQCHFGSLSSVCDLVFLASSLYLWYLKCHNDMLWWLLLGQLRNEPDNFVREENGDYIPQSLSKEFFPPPF